MASAEDVNIIMGEVGPLDDDILAVARLSDDRWVIRFAAVDVDVEHDEADDRIVLSVDLGVPPPLRATSVYATMLTYSAAWRDTGSIRMALTRPGGELLQMADVFAPKATATVLTNVAVNLAERALVWRGYVAEEAGEERPVKAAEIDFMSTDFLRI